MKRLMVFVLVVLMLCAGMAQAAEWRDGLSASQPYVGVRPVDLNEHLGYMMFYPSANMKAEYACQRLFIYLPREDVRAGSGMLYLCSVEDNQQIWSTAMNNTAVVEQRAITEEELNGLLWGSGTCFEVVLPKSLEFGKNYFVNMERNCIVSNDGKVDNPEVGGTDAWSFTLEGAFGVSGMEYRRMQPDGTYLEGITNPQAGDQIRFDLVLGGNATMAAVYAFNGVDFQTTSYTVSCEVLGTVEAEFPMWGVMFLDAQGNEVDRVEFW